MCEYESEKNVLVMNGNEIQTSVFSINMCDQLRYLTFQFGRIGERGGRHLDKHDLTLPFRVITEQFLECSELYYRPVVNTSDPSNEEHAARTGPRDSAIPFAKLP